MYKESIITLEVFKKVFSKHYDIETKLIQATSNSQALKEIRMALAVCTKKHNDREYFWIKFFLCFCYVPGDEAGLPKKPEPHMLVKVLDFFL